MADAFEPVKLRSPDGGLFTAHSAREVNDLVFGRGYKVVGNRDVADVVPAGTDTAKSTATKSNKENTGG